MGDLRTHILPVLGFLLAALAPNALFAQEAPNMTNMGVLLERHRGDLLYFDNCVSNLPLLTAAGDENDFRAEMIGLYRESLQHDFHAQLWYLQGDYGATRKELK